MNEFKRKSVELSERIHPIINDDKTLTMLKISILTRSQRASAHCGSQFELGYMLGWHYFDSNGQSLFYDLIHSHLTSYHHHHNHFIHIITMIMVHIVIIIIKLIIERNRNLIAHK